MRSSRRPFIFLTIFAFVTSVVSLCVGPMGVDFELIDLRAPRVLLGMFSGTVLGLCGCALQALMRNPLADPYILGVSGGAALFGTLSIAIFQSTQPFITPLAAFLGSLLVSLSLLLILKHESSQNKDRVILIGIAINTFASSLITIIKTLTPARTTQTLLFWLIGSIEYTDMTLLLLIVLGCLPFFFILMKKARILDLLSLGDQEALRLGVSVGHEKKIVYFCTSVLVGVSVSLCGMIAFVGLITPHLLRPFIGYRHAVLLPACGVLALIVVTSSDTLSRLSYSLFMSELPVGALLSLLGAPLFVWILLRGENHARR